MSTAQFETAHVLQRNFLHTRNQPEVSHATEQAALLLSLRLRRLLRQLHRLRQRRSRPGRTPVVAGLRSVLLGCSGYFETPRCMYRGLRDTKS